MWDSAMLNDFAYGAENLRVQRRGIPQLAKNERDTRISCTRAQETATCAAFIKESRMKFINANKLHRKSGGVGHPSLVEGTGLNTSAPSLLGKDGAVKTGTAKG